MCAGEFVNVYEEQYGAWDVTRLSLQALRFKMILVPVQAVLTCFFLDTAKNVFLYIRTIADIIRPGPGPAVCRAHARLRPIASWTSFQKGRQFAGLAVYGRT